MQVGTNFIFRITLLKRFHFVRTNNWGSEPLTWLVSERCRVFALRSGVVSVSVWLRCYNGAWVEFGCLQKIVSRCLIMYCHEGVLWEWDSLRETSRQEQKRQSSSRKLSSQYWLLGSVSVLLQYNVRAMQCPRRHTRRKETKTKKKGERMKRESDRRSHINRREREKKRVIRRREWSNKSEVKEGNKVREGKIETKK